MPRVHHVKRAQKDYPRYGIKAGDSYYWWKFRYHSRQMSKTYPKQSQLTQSEYLGTVYDLQDAIPDEITESYIDDLKAELEQLQETCCERLDAMPEQLQETSDSGIKLQERNDALEQALSTLWSIDFEDESGKEHLRDVIDSALADIGV